MSRVSPDGTVDRLLPSGLTIHAVSTLDIDFLYREIFEQEIYVQHGIKIAEGSIVMDCGANIGMFSIYAAEAAGPSVSLSLYCNTSVAKGVIGRACSLNPGASSISQTPRLQPCLGHSACM